LLALRNGFIKIQQNIRDIQPGCHPRGTDAFRAVVCGDQFLRRLRMFLKVF